MKKMKIIGMKSWVADNGIFPPFFTFLFLILTGIMVNRYYEKKKEVKFGNGNGSPLSDHFFFSACSEINSHFQSKWRKHGNKYSFFFAILFCFKILGLLYSVGKVYIKSTK